jgi:hypothetical protein
MHCLLSVVSTLIDFGYMHVYDWASHALLPMIPCKGCSLAKIQHHSLSSLIRVPHHHFTYDTVLRYTHCERPYNGGFLARYSRYFAYVALD